MTSTDAPAPDSALLHRARNGDPQALDQLVASYQERLLARIRLMMGPDARERLESTDVLQTVFSEAIGGLRDGELRDDRLFLRWLTAIARNHIAEQVRRRREQSLEVLSSELLAAHDGPVGAQLSAEESLQRLVELLESLNEERRTVVEWRALDGLRWQEIGTRLGKSEEAARKLYNRALIDLGRRLPGLPG
jgi:RNA polymerase sigma-70 factor (ECF subfamily)